VSKDLHAADSTPAAPQSIESHGNTGSKQAFFIAGGGYLALSLLVWWNLWANHPTSTTTCGCGDSSLFTWFLEWPAYAISHGLNPLHSTAMGYPGGVNLLANTSELAIGVVEAPITWLFGPVASLNVALTLAPALSALSMFVLLRRWVFWTPAAFFGGLLYGFSPFILVILSDAHLMLGMAFVPPLIVACADDLLVRHRRPPLVTGVLLGLLVTLQFFLGTELLVITAIMGTVGILIVVTYGGLGRTGSFRRKVRPAITGFAAAALTAGALLAYPVWYALAGPTHLSGPIWPGPAYEALRSGSTVLGYFVHPWPAANSDYNYALYHVVGGYQGPILSDQYFGIGVVIVLIGGCIAWRRDRRLWLFGAVGAVSVILSLGAKSNIWLPWRILGTLPQIQNIIPVRFVLITYLCVAVMLGLIVDHTYLAVNRWRNGLATASIDATPGRRPERRIRSSGAVAGLFVAAVALVPPAIYLAQTIPITTQPIDVPTWFRTVAPRLPGHQVLLVIPAPFSSPDNSMTWQAVDTMHYSMVGQGGPAGILERVGEEHEAAAVIAGASASSGPNASLAAGGILAVRQALPAWGVTTVVIPDQSTLPFYDRVRSETFAVTLMAAAVGERPVYQADAWVWYGVNHARPSAQPSVARFEACTTGVAPRGESTIETATACVLDAHAAP
jgi:hypothetical protein